MREEVPISHETFAGRLNGKQLHCRELGHVWRPNTVGSVPGGGYVRSLRCTSCRTEREQVLDGSGTVLKNRYVYPEGYLAAHVEPGLRRDVFRLEAVLRELGEIDQRKAG